VLILRAYTSCSTSVTPPPRELYSRNEINASGAASGGVAGRGTACLDGVVDRGDFLTSTPRAGDTVGVVTLFGTRMLPRMIYSATLTSLACSSCNRSQLQSKICDTARRQQIGLTHSPTRPTTHKKCTFGLETGASTQQGRFQNLIPIILIQ
jgi:hypothetical protein